MLAVRDLAAAAGVPLDELRRGVHATHDLHLHRPIRPGDVLSTVGPGGGVEARPPGAYVLMRLDSTDAGRRAGGDHLAGQPLPRHRGGRRRGRSTEARACRPSPGAEGDPGSRRRGWTETPVPLDAGAAHVYTECARIWNPIHTDPVAAQRAGLPAIILHGTATHALAVSEVVARYAGGDPTRVRRIGGRFGGMVLLPSTVTVATRRRARGRRVAPRWPCAPTDAVARPLAGRAFVESTWQTAKSNPRSTPWRSIRCHRRVRSA